MIAVGNYINNKRNVRKRLSLQDKRRILALYNILGEEISWWRMPNKKPSLNKEKKLMSWTSAPGKDENMNCN